MMYQEFIGLTGATEVTFEDYKNVVELDYLECGCVDKYEYAKMWLEQAINSCECEIDQLKTDMETANYMGFLGQVYADRRMIGVLESMVAGYRAKLNEIV